MHSSFTNRGKFKNLDWVFRGTAFPTNFYVALVTKAVKPTPDINTLGELTEIAAGNGYTAGGISLTRNITDFDTLTEDDAEDRALVQIKDLVWTAAAGPIPISGDPARYAVLTDDNVTLGSREVYAYWDLIEGRSVVATETITLQDLTLRLEEVL